jgi:glucose-1-phosphate cytidylyltransferase
MSAAPPAVILCGGLGLRQRDESDDLPKPLRPLSDGRPLLLHLIDHYRTAGVTEFVLCAGYGAARIREVLVRAYPAAGTTAAGGVRITVVDDGADATKAARMLSARQYVGDRPFLLGYCDVLSDLRLETLIALHDRAGTVLTLVATRSRSRYGIVEVGPAGRVSRFAEKPVEPSLISGGYFMCAPSLFDELDPELGFEDVVIPRLVGRGEVTALVHQGRWLALDTYKDFVDADAIMQCEGALWLTPA